MKIEVNLGYDWTDEEIGKFHQSLPEDATIVFKYNNPLRHPRFYHVLRGLNGRRWSAETTLVGPGLNALLAVPSLADSCDGIVAIYAGAAQIYGLIGWLNCIEKLARARYEVVANVPYPLTREWNEKFANLSITIVPQGEDVMNEPATPGMNKHVLRKCDGRAAVIWENGLFYPCTWAPVGGIGGGGVYAYGELGQAFEKKGRECHLIYCPFD